ncbi:hypothetical protein M0O54_19980 [Acinetobacter lactucae]|uniref:Uncharacterized protein n=1 Tax=Acinetobacter lactucae TaxID=1785128 RepID=A0AB35K976_9GAMM|nr:hypothetical protein [Acinetobacter lactucae]MDD9322352.1 hypothetical protein [Acinetobacter lactucae]
MSRAAKEDGPMFRAAEEDGPMSRGVREDGPVSLFFAMLRFFHIRKEEKNLYPNMQKSQHV